VTNIATIGTVGADWGSIRQEQKVGVGRDLISTLCALEAVYVEERLTIGDEKLDIEKRR
jgi:hypothetical protein